MKQTSFAQAEFAAKKKITRRERFLAEMEQAAPWSRLLKALSPYYYPDSRGMLMREGTIVDATIIAAPPSTKNRANVAKRPEFQGSDVVWHVAEKRGKLKKMEEGPRKTLTAQRERVKAQIRAKVEHPFHVVKNLFRHRKVRYRGLLKNTAQLFTLFGLANLVLARRLNPSPGA